MSHGRTSKQITAWGTEEDMEKLRVLVELDKAGSSSRWLIRQIRTRYNDVFGETPPSQLPRGIVSGSPENTA